MQTMLGNYSLLFTDILYTLPIILLIWTKRYKIVRLYLSTTIISTLFLTLYFFVIDPAAVRWGAWGYAENKTLDIWIYGALLDELIFTILVTFTISSAVVVLTHLEDRNLNLKDFLFKSHTNSS